MKKKKKKETPIVSRRNKGFDYDLEDTRLDPEIVSSTEMTGMIAAGDDDYDYDDFEEEE